MTSVNRKELFLSLEDSSAPGYVDFVGRSLHINLKLKYHGNSLIQPDEQGFWSHI